MTDIDSIIQNIPEITQIYIISHKYENKEILVHIEPGSRSFKIKSVEISSQVIEFESEWKQTSAVKMDHEGEFLIIPSPSIVKARAQTIMANDHGLTVANRYGNILFSNEPSKEVPGRYFKVISSERYKPKKLRSFLRSSHITESSYHSKGFLSQATCDV